MKIAIRLIILAGRCGEPITPSGPSPSRQRRSQLILDQLLGVRFHILPITVGGLALAVPLEDQVGYDVEVTVAAEARMTALRQCEPGACGFWA